MKRKALFTLSVLSLVVVSCGPNKGETTQEESKPTACECAKEIYAAGNKYPFFDYCSEMREADRSFEKVFHQCSYALISGKDTSEIFIPEKEIPSTVELSDGTYTIDPAESKVTWRGRKTITKESQSGLIDISAGSFSISDRQATGHLTINMSSVQVANLSAEKTAELEEQLKGKDFFNVKKYPEASFVVTESEILGNKVVLKGKLKIKGHEEDKTISLIVAEENGAFHATGAFRFDRSKYDVRYGSSSFYKNLGDAVIDDQVILNFELAGKVNAPA